MQSRMPVAAAIALAVLAAARCAGHGAPAGFVTRSGPKLLLDGREYRAIGVNMPNLHQSYFGTWFHNEQIYGTHARARQAILAALDDARRSGVAFVRFFANPGYPLDTSRLYAKDRARYWQLMDELFAECRKRNLKLVPSLQTLHGWYLDCGENARAILDPNSKTYQATHEYIREMVTRYRDDPTVLLWELENEAMLAADVDQLGRDLPPAAVYPPGAVVREKGAREDSLTWDMTLRLYREHAAFIKSLDPNHLVTSGDAAVRPECTSRRETFPDFRYRTDTLREWLANNLASQPEPLDVISYHVYGALKPARPGEDWGLTRLDLMRCQVRVAHAARVPVFIGELGQTDPSFKADPKARWARAAIDALEQEGVSLAALWVWHFPWQPELTVDSRRCPLLVERIRAFNRKHAALK